MTSDVDVSSYAWSTCIIVAKRLSIHKKDSKKRPYKKLHVHFNGTGWEQVNIIFINEHSLNNNNNTKGDAFIWLRQMSEAYYYICPTQASPKGVHRDQCKGVWSTPTGGNMTYPANGDSPREGGGGTLPTENFWIYLCGG